MDAVSWTNNVIAALIQLRGEGARDAVGNRLPLISALDTIPILGRYAPMLQDCIGQLQDHHGAPRGAIDVQYVGDDGLVDGGFAAASAIANRIKLVDYLAGYGADGRAHERRLSLTATKAYTFYVGELFSNMAETGLVSFHRQAIADWQRGINASASAIRHNAMNLTAPMAAVDNAAFWAAIRSLASSLSVIKANPPEDVFDRIKGATSDALDKTGTFIGESAAKLAEKAGEIAGHTAQGFFAEAGIASMLVAGLAVYMVIK